MLSRAIAHAKEFKYLEKFGFIGYRDKRIQTYKDIVDTIPGRITVTVRGCSQYNYEVSKKYKGYIFFYLSEKNPGCRVCEECVKAAEEGES